MELLAAAETLAGRELLTCHGAPADLIEAALQGPGDLEGARQLERAEQERGEHGQGDKPAAWRMQGRGVCWIWRMQGR